MPRIIKADMKESIVSFANESVKIINENLNLNDLTNREDKPIPVIESDGWYYYLHKSIADVNNPEIRIRRQNYRPKYTKFYKDQPKGNRINEEACIYKKGMNCRILGIDENGQFILDKEDHGFLIDGFSVQDYQKSAF
tara:strand:+ start:137 stop:550 length:414 start_codon:yes stop_codon:yes gene_type:complete